MRRRCQALVSVSISVSASHTPASPARQCSRAYMVGRGHKVSTLCVGVNLCLGVSCQLVALVLLRLHLKQPPHTVRYLYRHSARSLPPPAVHHAHGSARQYHSHHRASNPARQKCCQHSVSPVCCVLCNYSKCSTQPHTLQAHFQKT